MTMARVARSCLRAAALAAITGSRTALGPALVARRQTRPAWLRAAVYVAAVMELIGDKMPRVPNRTAPLGLALRIVSGAGVARALLRRRVRKGAGLAGALALGATAAIASAFAGLRLRLILTRRLGGGALANALAGTIEDAALVTIGARLAEPS
jgi:uncharacterized membrane protein